jgi:hypothetical protein
MVPADSGRVPRAPPYSGCRLACSSSVYGAVTRYGLPFQACSTPCRFAFMRPYNPSNAETPLVWACPRSLATTMFQFPGFASRLAAGYPIARVGCPIRAPADQWLFAPPRGLSQLITPFFASESQGIHRTPLLTFFNRIPVSLFLSFTSNCFPACQRTL